MQEQQEHEIEKLKALVEKDLAISADTNKMVRQLRRGARWTFLFQIFYWLLILGALGASYYYVSPYVGSALNIFNGIEHYFQQPPSNSH